jgi:hypothetical protein
VNLRQLAALCGMCTACFDPNEKFQDFVDAKKALATDAGTTTPGGNTVPLLASQVDGVYLYAVSTPAAPLQPTVYLAEVEGTQTGTQLSVRIRQQPLSKLDRATPVGDWSEWLTTDVDVAGKYETGPILTVVPAAANSVLPLDTTTEISFSGLFVNPSTPDMMEAKVQLFCGTGAGRAISPIALDLTGTTFAATRITDPADPSSYPAVVINCNMDPAQPL